MAKNLSKAGITINDVIYPQHITQSIDAFTGQEAYDIYLSGSLTVTGSITGTINLASTSSKFNTTVETGSSTQHYLIFGGLSSSAIQGVVNSQQAYINPNIAKYTPSTNTLSVTSSQAISSNSSSYSLNYGSNFIITSPPTALSSNIGLMMGKGTLSLGSASIAPSAPVLFATKILGTDFFVTATKSTPSSSPSLYITSITPSGSFEVRDAIGVSSNDTFNFQIMYTIL